MRVNGILSYLIEQTSSFDEDGVPTPAEPTWSQPVECLIQTNTHNERGTYQDGKFTQASYLVLIERQHLDRVPSRVRLKRCVEQDLIDDTARFTSIRESFVDKDGSKVYVIDDSGFDDLGEFEVQDFQRVHLDRFRLIL